MHHLKVKTGRPVRVFFSEEVHSANLTKKRKPRVIRGFRINNIILKEYYFLVNDTRRLSTRPSSVELSAIGLVSPKALTFTLEAVTPELTK
jgi:hypothetical protein